MRKVSVFALASLMTLGATAVMAQATPSTSMDKPATTSGSMSKKTATTTKKTTTHAMSAKGAVTAMDATAKTITVGSNTYTTSDATKYMAHGKKAMMTDVKVGDTVSVSYTKDGDTMTATRVTVTKAAKM
jgi:hypothetical protein